MSKVSPTRFHKLVAYRVLTGDSQEDIARKAELSPSQLSNLERGKFTSMPRKRTVKKLAKAYGTTPERLTKTFEDFLK